MTIITLALTSDQRLVLVADRVYAPFSNPQFMRKPKIFRRGSIVVGVSGDICAVDLEELLDGKLIEKPTPKAHIIVVNEESNSVVIAKPCGDDTFSTWFDPILTGEPVSIGCFAHIVDTGFYGSIPSVELAVDRINYLHLAFGYAEPADVIELNMDRDKAIFDSPIDSYLGDQPKSSHRDKAIFDSLVNSYFGDQLKSSAAFLRTSSTGMPLTDYASNENLLSGCLSLISATDFERLAHNVAKLYNATTKGRVQP